MNDFKGVGEALKRVFTQFHWIYILEGFLCFLLIYTVLKILVENNAKRLIVTYTLILLITGVVSLFSKIIDITTFCSFLLIFSLFFLLLFNMEIKRSVWNIKKRQRGQRTCAQKESGRSRGRIYQRNRKGGSESQQIEYRRAHRSFKRKFAEGNYRKRRAAQFEYFESAYRGDFYSQSTLARRRDDRVRG